MQKYVPLMFIFALFLITCIAACGGSGTSASTPVFNYDLPTSLAPSPHTPLMGGAIQVTPLVLGNTVSTLAGTAGSAGFVNYTSNSNIAATFNHPTDITTDGTNFYVADYGNNAIRRITAGVVRTLQCTDVDTGVAIGFNRPSGITTDGINLYVADTGSNTIRFIEIGTNKVTTIGSTTGLAGSIDSVTDKTAVRFNQPIGTTTDGVNVYVTDYNNATVRRIDIATKAVYTMAGTSGAIGSTDGIQGAARFNRPGRITTDGFNLYLTDFFNRTIRQIVISSGVVSTLAGSAGKLGLDNGTLDGITGTAARFNQPNGITTDGTNLYVTDSNLNTIRKIDKDTGAVTTLPIPSSTLHTPIGITTDGVSLFVADTLILNTDYSNTYSNSIIRIQ